MSSNKRDENHVANIAGVSSLTFAGNIEPAVDPTTHELLTQATIPSVTHTNTHTGNDELRVYSESNISAENSYNSTLGIGETFTGVWTDCTNYSEVIVTVNASHESTTNGLKVEWSMDGITKDGDDVFTISAASSKTFSFPCQTKYVRVVYTNNGVAEASLRIQTLLKRFASKGSSHRLKDNLNQEDDAIVTKSQIVGFTTGGGGGTDLINVKVNPSGALTVDVGASVLPTGAAKEATLSTINGKLVSGTDIGDVTINNAGGASAVNIQDGGNTITVDGTVTVTQATATNLKTQAENYQGGTAVGSANPLQVTLANTGANATAIKVDNSAVTQPVSGTVTANPTPNTTIYNGQKAVTTAGTRVALAASQAVKWVIVKAKATNTGNIFVGDSTVSSSNGYILTPGEAIGLDVANLATVYLDSAVNTEGISYIAMN